MTPPDIMVYSVLTIAIVQVISLVLRLSGRYPPGP